MNKAKLSASTQDNYKLNIGGKLTLNMIVQMYGKSYINNQKSLLSYAQYIVNYLLIFLTMVIVCCLS